MKTLQQGTGLLCMLAGGYFIVDYMGMMDQAMSAPQQAAAAAMTMAKCIPVYVIFRGLEMITSAQDGRSGEVDASCSSDMDSWMRKIGVR